MEKVVFDRPLAIWLARQFDRTREAPLSAALAADRRITAQAANHQLRRLVATGVLTARLEGRRKLYRFRPLRQASKSYERASIEEDGVWRNLIAPCLDGFSEGPAMRVLEFGCTETNGNRCSNWPRAS